MAKTVLVTDDTAFMRMTMRNMLEKHGYEVVAEAGDGKAAVEQYKLTRPDVVTMDITMPVMDGITATAEILALDSQATVIVVSAMGQKALVIEALTAGAKDFVVKPFEEDRLLEALGKVMARKGA